MARFAPSLRVVVAHPSFAPLIEQWADEAGYAEVVQQREPTGMLDAILLAASAFCAAQAAPEQGGNEIQIWTAGGHSVPGGTARTGVFTAGLRYGWILTGPHLPSVLRGQRTLVAAHGNSLRALIMVLEKLTPEQILKRELATGAPVIYRLNADSTVATKVDLAA